MLLLVCVYLACVYSPSFPPLLSALHVVQQERAIRGFTSQSQSLSRQLQVTTPVTLKCLVAERAVLTRATPSGATCGLFNRLGKACEYQHPTCAAYAAQQNTYLLCHTLLLNPVFTASLTWCIKRSYKTHFFVGGRGRREMVNAAFE